MLTPTAVPDLFNLQALPAGTPTWLIALSILGTVSLALIPTLYLIMQGRNERLKKSNEVKDAVHVETLRSEMVATSISKAALMPEAFKILYIGSSEDDEVKVIKNLNLAGISNMVVTRNDAEDGFKYLQEHPLIQLVIIFVEDLQKGIAFLDMVTGSQITKNKPVVFIDGNIPAAELAAWKGGAAGVLHHPLDVGALLVILNREGFTTVISPDAEKVVITP